MFNTRKRIKTQDSSLPASCCSWRKCSFLKRNAISSLKHGQNSRTSAEARIRSPAETDSKSSAAAGAAAKWGSLQKRKKKTIQDEGIRAVTLPSTSLIFQPGASGFSNPILQQYDVTPGATQEAAASRGTVTLRPPSAPSARRGLWHRGGLDQLSLNFQTQRGVIPLETLAKGHL